MEMVVQVFNCSYSSVNSVIYWCVQYWLGPAPRSSTISKKIRIEYWVPTLAIYLVLHTFFVDCCKIPSVYCNDHARFQLQCFHNMNIFPFRHRRWIGVGYTCTHFLCVVSYLWYFPVGLSQDKVTLDVEYIYTHDTWRLLTKTYCPSYHLLYSDTTAARSCGRCQRGDMSMTPLHMTIIESRE